MHSENMVNCSFFFCYVISTPWLSILFYFLLRPQINICIYNKMKHDDGAGGGGGAAAAKF